MNTPVYICEGTCKAEITEEQYTAGLTTCGADGCTLKGHAFEKMYKCTTCNEIKKENTIHPHQ